MLGSWLGTIFHQQEFQEEPSWILTDTWLLSAQAAWAHKACGPHVFYISCLPDAVQPYQVQTCCWACLEQWSCWTILMEPACFLHLAATCTLLEALPLDVWGRAPEWQCNVSKRMLEGYWTALPNTAPVCTLCPSPKLREAKEQMVVG